MKKRIWKMAYNRQSWATALFLAVLTLGQPIPSQAKVVSKNHEDELTRMIDLTTREFCKNSDNEACKTIKFFQKGHVPHYPIQTTFFLGPRFASDFNPRTNQGYFVLFIAPAEGNLAATWLKITPDNESEDAETKIYLQSIREKHRQKNANFHQLLEQQLKTIQFVETKIQNQALFLQIPGFPNGVWIRENQEEWIVLGILIQGTHPQLFVARMPIDFLPLSH